MKESNATTDSGVSSAPSVSWTITIVRTEVPEAAASSTCKLRTLSHCSNGGRLFDLLAQAELWLQWVDQCDCRPGL